MVMSSKRSPGRPTASNAREISERILATAERLIVALGYEMTTMERIARDAQVSKRTLYDRHPNKEKLFCVTMTHVSKRKFEEFEHVQLGAAPLQETLVDLCKTYVNMIAGSNFLVLRQILQAETARFPGVADDISSEGMLRVSRIVARIFARHPDCARRDEVDMLVDSTLFTSMVIVPAIRRHSVSSEGTVDDKTRMIERSVEIFLNGSLQTSK